MPASWKGAALPDDAPRTGPALKAARKAAGLSRRALAELCGLHPDSIRYWERKDRIDPHGHACRLIFAALGIPQPQRIYRTVRDTLREKALGHFPRITRARGGVLQRTGNCGARTRKGTPCRAKPLPGKSRCKFHGGASTGPRTPEGKTRIAIAQRQRWAAWRASVKIRSRSGQVGDKLGAETLHPNAKPLV